jgi:hypothetical protein
MPNFCVLGAKRSSGGQDGEGSSWYVDFAELGFVFLLPQVPETGHKFCIVVPRMQPIIFRGLM